jgi:hypothetical protein
MTDPWTWTTDRLAGERAAPPLSLQARATSGARYEKTLESYQQCGSCG